METRFCICCQSQQPKDGFKLVKAGSNIRRWKCAKSHPETLASSTLGQSGIWGHGISGDLPILLVRVTDVSGVPLVRQVLMAQEHWRLKGLKADAVILNAMRDVSAMRRSTLSHGARR